MSQQEVPIEGKVMTKQFWICFLKPLVIGLGILMLLAVLVLAIGSLFHWLGIKVVAVVWLLFVAWCVGQCWLEEND